MTASAHTSDAVYAAFGLAYLVVFIASSIVCWLKGKYLWATVGALTGWQWIPALLLAKPDSWWARRYYDQEKMARAAARFPPAAGAAPVPPPASPNPAVSGSEEWEQQQRDIQKAFGR